MALVIACFQKQRPNVIGGCPSSLFSILNYIRPSQPVQVCSQLFSVSSPKVPDYHVVRWCRRWSFDWTGTFTSRYSYKSSVAEWNCYTFGWAYKYLYRCQPRWNKDGYILVRRHLQRFLNRWPFGVLWAKPPNIAWSTYNPSGNPHFASSKTEAADKNVELSGDNSYKHKPVNLLAAKSAPITHAQTAETLPASYP